MRVAVRSLCIIAAVAAIAIACGSGTGSEFVDPNANLDDAAAPPPIGSFNPAVEAGAGADGSATCTKLTCATAKANCGPIGDGCGGVVQCGTCGSNESCGGGGVPSTCGKPPCTKKTCADTGANCGALGDGCGGLIASCGTCDAGICGGGGPSKCGTGGAGGDGGGGPCVKTKTACAAGDCGPIADGCGGLLDCSPPAWPACPAGQSCGGGNVPSVCGAPPCVKKTCGTQNCGFIADGCGGSVSCWPAPPAPPVCGPGESCGGALVANTCGTPPGCTGLCQQQVTCPGGGTTGIEGYVTSPNGVLPVPNAVVYVPNGVVDAFTANVKCETCATASGNPLVTTTTDANGHFLLPNMPVSMAAKVTDIPVVVQLGRWRKQFTITTTACTNNLVPAYGAAVNKTAALPTRKSEGDIPLTAIATGYVDGLECVFRKMGVDDSEFTHGTGTGRIRLYRDLGEGSGTGGACAPGCGAACVDAGNAACPRSDALTCPAGKKHATCTQNNHCAGNSCVNNVCDGGCTVACPGGACTNEIDKYDAVLFECVGGESKKVPLARQNVVNYANKGGRVFATHYSYVWLFSTASPVFASPWDATTNKWAANTAEWNATPSAGPPVVPGSLSAMVDTSFAKGVLFSTWLQAPVAPLSATYAPPYGAVNGLYASSPPRLALTEPRKDIQPTAPNQSTSGIIQSTTIGGVVQPLAQRWIYTTDDHDKVCVNPADCKSGTCTGGKCVGSQVFQYGDGGKACNNNGQCLSGTCNNNKCTLDPPAQDAPMHYTFNTDTTKAAAQQCGRVVFSDFHVSTGSNTNDKVFPAECDNNPLTAQEKVLAYTLFDLASCVSTSGPPACVKKTCAAQNLACGLAGDGCGNQIDCGPCLVPGQSCGGGGVPSQCGSPPCNAKVCQPGQCGKLGNGCGGTLDCGACGMGTCGGGGANVCGVANCNPMACPAPAAGSVCGPVADGCGLVNNCPCPAGLSCVNGSCGVPGCTPTTCALSGKNCGQLADGCGGILACGSCIAPQSCGGGGTANLCGGGVN